MAYYDWDQRGPEKWIQLGGHIHSVIKLKQIYHKKSTNLIYTILIFNKNTMNSILFKRNKNVNNLFFCQIHSWKIRTTSYITNKYWPNCFQNSILDANYSFLKMLNFYCQNRSFISQSIFYFTSVENFPLFLRFHHVILNL